MILKKLGKLSVNDWYINNITVDFRKHFDEIKNNFIFPNYTITGAPRPEILAWELYGDMSYEWLLLLINNVDDPWHGWIRPDEYVREYANKKYDNVDDIHHLYDVDNPDDIYYDLVESSPNSDQWYHVGDTTFTHLQYAGVLVPVTNLEFEIQENEKLRNIKIASSSDVETLSRMVIKQLSKS